MRLTRCPAPRDSEAPSTTAFYLAARWQVKKIFPGYANPVGEYIEILIQEGKEEIFLT